MKEAYYAKLNSYLSDMLIIMCQVCFNYSLKSVNGLSLVYNYVAFKQVPFVLQVQIKYFTKKHV